MTSRILWMAALIALVAASCGKKQTSSVTPPTVAGDTAGLLEQAKKGADEAIRFTRELEELLLKRQEAPYDSEERKTLTARAGTMKDHVGSARRLALELFEKALSARPNDPAVLQARVEARSHWLTRTPELHPLARTTLIPLSEQERTIRFNSDSRQFERYTPVLIEPDRQPEVRGLLADLKKLIELNPEDTALLLRQGDVTLYEYVERYEEFYTMVAGSELLPFCDRAISDFTQALLISPSHPDAYFGRARAYWAKAMITFHQVLFKHKNSGLGYSHKEAADLVRSNSEHVDQAQRNIKEAVQLGTERRHLYVKFARQMESADFYAGRKPTTYAVAVAKVIPKLTVQDVYEKCAPAVVLINTSGPKGGGTGSGFVVHAGGTILTNEHVVRGANTITVMLKDGRRFSAQAVATHDVYDLALVRISSPPTGLKALSISIPPSEGFWNPPRIGDDILAIGHPANKQWTLTTGKVSQYRGSKRDPNSTIYVQTDAALNPGNSGGPLLDLYGQVIGVVTQGGGKVQATDTQGNPVEIQLEQLNFAIYRDVAKSFVEKYIR